MAVKLRLMRMGKKKQPTYRVVAADSRAPRDGRFIEIVGFYEPRQSPSKVKIDTDRAVHWLQHGAQPTERVKKLLRISGVWEVFRSPTPVAPVAPSRDNDSPTTDTAQNQKSQKQESSAADLNVADEGNPDTADSPSAASSSATTTDTDIDSTATSAADSGDNDKDSDS